MDMYVRKALKYNMRLSFGLSSDGRDGSQAQTKQAAIYQETISPWRLSSGPKPLFHRVVDLLVGPLDQHKITYAALTTMHCCYPMTARVDIAHRNQLERPGGKSVCICARANDDKFKASLSPCRFSLLRFLPKPRNAGT